MLLYRKTANSRPAKNSLSLLILWSGCFTIQKGGGGQGKSVLTDHKYWLYFTLCR